MHPKWLSFRYKLFRYRRVEQALAQQLGKGRLLDIGCGDGENLLRFRHFPLRGAGVEVFWPRLQEARRHGLDVAQASGTELPFAAQSFDLIYIAHVLHHVEAYEQVLQESRRCLVAGGTIFLVETVNDNPLLRLARRLRPVWQGDHVEAQWTYAGLRQILESSGLTVEESGRYNLFFFLWEMLPLAFWPFEIFTPLFVYLDLALERLFPAWAAHTYFVLRT